MAYAVYGTGGFAREVMPLVCNVWKGTDASGPEVRAAKDFVFVDDAEDKPDTLQGYPVIDFADLSSDAHKHRSVVVAVGSGDVRRKLEDRCIAVGIAIRSVIAPTAKLLSSVELGAGTVLCDYVVLTANISIGRSFQANLFSYVGHDCVIGDYVTFAPRVSCNGNVHIGDNVYVGTGAVIIQGAPDKPLTIGEGAIVGMGSVVTKPVPPRTLVAGNPARAIRTLD